MPTQATPQIDALIDAIRNLHTGPSRLAAIGVYAEAALGELLALRDGTPLPEPLPAPRFYWPADPLDIHGLGVEPWLARIHSTLLVETQMDAGLYREWIAQAFGHYHMETRKHPAVDRALEHHLGMLAALIQNDPANPGREDSVTTRYWVRRNFDADATTIYDANH